MTKKKSPPMRMCIACHEMKPKKDMTRVVKNAAGDIFADLSGKAPGRGAYICNDTLCLQKLQDKKLLHKAFSMQVDAQVYSDVKEENLAKE